MALDVGSVVTFFEGFAEGLFNTINAVEKTLEDLSKKTFKINIEIPDDLAANIKEPSTAWVKALHKLPSKQRNPLRSYRGKAFLSRSKPHKSP